MNPDARIVRAGASYASLASTFWFQFLILSGAALVLIAVDVADGVLYLGDVDDRFREMQIRDLVGDGEWFDRTLPFIQMPEAYVSPWSRLVDAPYAAIAWLLGPLIGFDAALDLAFMAVPALLLLAFCAAALTTLRGLEAFVPGPVQLLLTALLMGLAFWEFSPGRIDHHNLQLVAIMTMIAGLCLPSRDVSRMAEYAGGALAGVAAVLSVSIGLECLPFIFAALAIVGLNAIWGSQAARGRVSGCGPAMAISAPLAGLALLGVDGTIRTACDSFSAPWIAGMAGGGAILGLAGSSYLINWSRTWRITVLISIAAGLAGLLAVSFPACLAGPYQMVDEVARTFWLDRVAQEKSALAFFSEGQYGLVAILAVCGFLLIAVAPSVRDRLLAGDERHAIIWTIGVVALTLTLFQVRFVRFVPAFAPLLMPIFAAWISQASASRRKSLLAAAVAAPVLVALAAFAVTPQEARRYDAVDLMTWDECEGADFSILERVQPGRIMAPPGLSFAIAENPGAHRIASLSFHRAAPGISRVAHAFTSSDPALRRESLAPFDYVAVCIRKPSFDLGDALLFQALLKGEGWPGLIALTPHARNGFGLYRIDHKSLK